MLDHLVVGLRPFMRKCVLLHMFSRTSRWFLGRTTFALMPVYMIRLAFCAVALGSTEPEPDYFESQPTTLLQHGLQVTSLDRQDKQAAELLSEIQNLRIMNQGSPVLPNIDANGRLCFLCGTPSEERAPNQTYVIRDDCGNHSLPRVFRDDGRAFEQLPAQCYRRA